MKKVLSLVLVIAMVLSMTTVAFAGTFEDVTDADTAKAVDALTALNIVNGYEDGTYKPNGSITRAEIAKLLVVALGNGDLAEGSSSSFKDAQGKWYDGYVAIAQSLGLTNGYPDGTFKGENSVSYTEAITMIMRALGYNDQSVNSNRSDVYNATSYKTAASRLGILKNVTVKSGNANRGDVAVMLYNTLECTVVIVDKDGNPVAQTVVVGANTTAKTLLDQIAVADTITVAPNTVVEDTREYEKSLIDLEPYMYQTLTVYKNSSEEIVFVKVSSSDVVEGALSETSATNDNKVVIDSTSYTLATPGATPVYYNGKEVTVTEADLEGTGLNSAMQQLNGAEVTAILNSNDQIVKLVATLPTKGFQIDTEYVSGKTTLNGASIKLPVKNSKVNLDALTIKGDATSLEDIKENDVVTVYSPAGDTSATAPSKLTLVVTRNSVDGKITKTNADGEVFIDSQNEYFAVSSITNAVSTLVAGNNGTFYFDEFGDIFAFEATSTTTNYAVVLETVNGGTVGGRTFNPEIVLLNTKGEELTFEIKNDATLVNASDSTVLTGLNFNGSITQDMLVKYAVNSSNKVTSITIVDNDLTTSVNTDTTSNSFVLAGNAVVFNKEASADYSLVNSALTGYVDVVAKVTNAYGEITLLIVDGLGNTADYAYITKVETAINNNGTTVQLVSGYMNGEFFSKYTDAANVVTSSAINGNNIYKLTLVGDEITAYSLVNNATTGNNTLDAYIGKTVDANVTNRHITVSVNNGAAQYTITEDTIVYVQKTLSNGDVVFSAVADKTALSKDSVINVYCEDGTTTAAIIVVQP